MNTTTHSAPGEPAVAPDVTGKAGRTYLSVLDLSPEALETCLSLAGRLKRERRLGANAPTAGALAGHSLALLFDKHRCGPGLDSRSRCGSWAGV